MSDLRRWRWALGILTVACAVVAVPLSPLGSIARGEDPPPFTVTVSPVTLLTDGQPVSITIRSDAAYPLYSAEIRLCRGGVAYLPSSAGRPNPDFELGGPNCPPAPITSSADLSITDNNVFLNAPTPDGSISRYRMGSGTTTWTNADGPQELTCDATHTCALVVEVYGGPIENIHWEPVAVDLSFRDEDPVAGCGGPADGILLSGGSDRMADAWVQWTLDECRLPGRTGGTSRAVFTGEGPAVDSYNIGGLDFVYTAGGFDPDIGLVKIPEGEKERPSIAVPVAVNASVLGVSGGRRNATGVKVPYEDIRLTLEEVAALISGGSPGIQPHYNDIFTRNPELNETGFFDTPGTGFLVAAPAEAEATSWFFTHHLLQQVPDEWVVPDLEVYGTDQGRDRGADAYLALADPTFAPSLTLLSGRPPLRKGVEQQLLNPFATGGSWVLTDLETATSLGMTLVKVAAEPGAGDDDEFVEATAASIYAGVASMVPGHDGMLVPDSAATAPVDGVTPYPMAFIEYALVPAQPLMDATCERRADSQVLLSNWLTYLTGAGQAKLPAGLLPLPDDLAEQAAAAIAKVGQSPVTGACAAVLPPNTPPTTQPVAPIAPVTVPSLGGGSTYTPPGDTPPPTTPSSVTTVPDDVIELVAVPAFAGRQEPGWTGSALAMVGITALSGLAALGAATSRPRPRRRRAVG